MILVYVDLVKNIKNVVVDSLGIILVRRMDMEEDDSKFYEAIANVLLRLASLEKILIDKDVINKEEYVSILNQSAKQLQKEMMTQNVRSKKMLS